MSIRAQTLAILHHVYSSANACLPLPPCPFEPERPSPLELERSPSPPPCLLKRKCSFPTSITSNRARTLVSHLHWLECSPSTSTMSIRAQMLVSHLHRVYSSPNARHPSQPLPFEHNRSFPVFYRHRIFFSVFWIVFEAQFVWVNLSTYMLILLI